MPGEIPILFAVGLTGVVLTLFVWVCRRSRGTLLFHAGRFYCVACGYDVTESVDGCCTECGADVLHISPRPTHVPVFWFMMSAHLTSFQLVWFLLAILDEFGLDDGAGPRFGPAVYVLLRLIASMLFGAAYFGPCLYALTLAERLGRLRERDSARWAAQYTAVVQRNREALRLGTIVEHTRPG